ncbi:hypothetical protein ACED63_23680 [Vibrio splendidus]|uniref:hypothetical protein n=1 Tax=Vibrio splendidus TaxID=29497 RepID=UPI00352F8147
MDIPKFSQWVKFAHYKEMDCLSLPGVYVLAHFSSPPENDTSIHASYTVYIGETTSQKLSSRLYQFGRSAFLKKNGHSGGHTYSRIFLDNKPLNEVPDNLYVAVLLVDRLPKESKAYIKLVERLAIWEFFQKNGDYPSCNTA